MPSLGWLPTEVLSIVLKRSSESVLLRARETCRAWQEVSSSGDLWLSRVEKLKEGKYIMSTALKTQMMSSFKLFWSLLHDSTRTVFQSAGEISGIWCFRFKAAAGQSWVQDDPWWNGGSPIKLRLKLDGTMEAVTDAPGLWGPSGSPAGRYNITTENARSVVRENGHPSMPLFRHPVHWGMFMQSAWAVWTQFPMPPRGVDPLMEDDSLSVCCDDATQALEIRLYNTNLCIQSSRSFSGGY